MIDFPDEGISKGEMGTVVMAFCEPSEADEVEFVNKDGTTNALNIYKRRFDKVSEPGYCHYRRFSSPVSQGGSICFASLHLMP